MDFRIRIVLAAAVALVVLAGVPVAARPVPRHDRLNAICVIAGDINFCAPERS